MTLLSTFVAANPTTQVLTWDKKEKEMVRVSRPNVVAVYNKSMGGVDLLASLIALYHIKIRSKKWYHSIVFRMLDLTLVQAWLLYRRDCQSQMPENVQFPLLVIKIQVASFLCMKNRVSKKRKGRPLHAVVVRKNKRGPQSFVPPDPVHRDRTNHWPVHAPKKSRCKMPRNKVKSKCSKYTVFLCFTAESALLIFTRHEMKSDQMNEIRSNK